MFGKGVTLHAKMFEMFEMKNSVLGSMIIMQHVLSMSICVENGWSVDFQEMPQGIYSSLVERRPTERRKVNSVSSFDIQEVPFRESQETQVQSQAELLG